MEEPAEPTVSIDEFGRIDLRVAVVLAVGRVAGTDRLLELEIDLGVERRTIVSGIAPSTNRRPWSDDGSSSWLT